MRHGGQVSAESLTNFFTDTQANAMAITVHLYALPVRGLEVRRKQVPLVDFVHPNAHVLDLNLGINFGWTGFDSHYCNEDHASFKRELDCVGEQVD